MSAQGGRRMTDHRTDADAPVFFEPNGYLHDHLTESQEDSGLRCLHCQATIPGPSALCVSCLAELGGES